MKHTEKKTIPHRSWQSVKLQRFFADMAVGQFVTYAELGAIVDQADVRWKDVSKNGVQKRMSTRHILDGALNRALRDNGAVVVCVHNEGYRRVGGAEKLDPVGYLVKAAGKKGRKADVILRTTSNDEWTAMSDQDHVAFLGRKLQADMIAKAARPSTARAVEIPANSARPILPPAWTNTTGSEEE
jgi:hypothetical protein